MPGVSAVFAASTDLANFTGYAQRSPDYERAINIVHDAAIKAGVRLCGPLAWRDRADFSLAFAPVEGEVGETLARTAGALSTAFERVILKG